MSNKIIMPKMSSNMEKGTIIDVHVQDGQIVAKDDLLFTIETDKTIAEISASLSGVLALSPSVTIGMEYPVDSILGFIMAEGEPPPTFETEELPSEPALIRRKPLATPIVRKIAKDHGIDLSSIQGSGPEGRIRREDIEAYQKQHQPSNSFDHEKLLFTPTRTHIIAAERITRSWKEAPHIFLEVDIDMTNILQFKKQSDYALRLEYGQTLSLTAIIIQEVAKTLIQHPRLASSYTPEGIVQRSPSDICCAIATDNGLVAPILKDVADKPLRLVQDELSSLIKAARSGKLPIKVLDGGSFTVSNLGMFGILSFTSILNQGQSGILALGSIIKKPIVLNDQIVIRPIMRMTLSIDHRSVDGVHGARFMKALKDRLES